MRFFVAIDCDNAAFEDQPGAEVARILLEIARKTPLFSFAHPESTYPLRDVNGNICGRFGYMQNAED
jgi:hypothetical protein